MTDAKEVGWGTLGETFRHRAYPLLGEKIDKSKVFLRRFFPAIIVLCRSTSKIIFTISRRETGCCVRIIVESIRQSNSL